MSNQNITPIVGLPQTSGWSQVVDSIYQGFTLIFVFSLQGEGAVDNGKAFVKEILELKALDIKVIYDYVLSLATRCAGLQLKLSVSAGLFKDDQASVLCLDSNVLLNREGRVGVLLSAQREITVTVGKVQKNDLYVFSTKASEIWLELIVQKLTEGKASDAIVTSLVPEIHGLEDSSRHSLAFFSQKFDEKKQKRNQSLISLLLVVFLFVKKGLILSFRFFASLFVSIFKSINYLFSKDEYLGKRKQKKMLVKVVVVLFFLLVLLGIWWMLRERKQTELKEAEAFTSSFTVRRNSIENKSNSDPTSARQELQSLLSETKSLVSQLDPESSKQLFLSEEIDLEEQLYDQISGQKEFAELQTYFDLRLADSAFVASKVASSGSYAAFVDQEKKSAILLELNQKKAEVLDLSQVGEVIDLAVMEDNILFLSKSGIWRYSTSRKEIERIISEGDSNRDALLIAGFDPYIYVFNGVKRNIYRYAPKDEGYTEPIGWLVDKQNLVFSDIVNLAIDGDVWLSTKQGEILRYSSGEKNNFVVSGLSDGLTSSVMIDTRPDFSSIYILESEKNRVVVLKKTGEFLQEVKSQSLQTVTDIFVSDDENTLFAVSGSIVYSIPVSSQ